MVAVNLSPIIIPRNSRQEESRRIPLPYHFVNIMENLGYRFMEDIIWEKPEYSVKNRNGSFYRHRKPIAYKPNLVTEYILIFQKPSKKIMDKILKEITEEQKVESLVKDTYERTNIWKIKPNNNSKHPAPFPKDLADKLILYYSYKNETILDMFGGSGTVGISANKNDRKYILIEKKKEYIELIEENLGINHQ